MLSHNLLLKPGYSQNTGESFHNDGMLESLDKRQIESDLYVLLTKNLSSGLIIIAPKKIRRLAIILKPIPHLLVLSEDYSSSQMQVSLGKDLFCLCLRDALNLISSL